MFFDKEEDKQKNVKKWHVSFLVVGPIDQEYKVLTGEFTMNMSITCNMLYLLQLFEQIIFSLIWAKLGSSY